MGSGNTRPHGLHSPALYFIGLALGVLITILGQHSHAVRFAGIEEVFLTVIGSDFGSGLKLTFTRATSSVA